MESASPEQDTYLASNIINELNQSVETTNVHHCHVGDEPDRRAFSALDRETYIAHAGFLLKEHPSGMILAPSPEAGDVRWSEFIDPAFLRLFEAGHENGQTPLPSSGDSSAPWQASTGIQSSKSGDTIDAGQVSVGAGDEDKMGLPPEERHPYREAFTAAEMTTDKASATPNIHGLRSHGSSFDMDPAYARLQGITLPQDSIAVPPTSRRLNTIHCPMCGCPILPGYVCHPPLHQKSTFPRVLVCRSDGFGAEVTTMATLLRFIETCISGMAIRMRLARENDSQHIVNEIGHGLFADVSQALAHLRYRLDMFFKEHTFPELPFLGDLVLGSMDTLSRGQGSV